MRRRKRYLRGSILESINRGKTNFTSIGKDLYIADSSLHDALRDLTRLGYINADQSCNYSLTAKGKDALEIRSAIQRGNVQPYGAEIAHPGLMNLLKDEIAAKRSITSWVYLSPDSTFTCRCGRKVPLHYPLTRMTCPECGRTERPWEAGRQRK